MEAVDGRGVLYQEKNSAVTRNEAVDECPS